MCDGKARELGKRWARAALQMRRALIGDRFHEEREAIWLRNSEQIRAAIQRVLTEPGFGESARRMAGILAKEDGAQAAAEEIESVVRQHVGTSDERGVRA